VPWGGLAPGSLQLARCALRRRWRSASVCCWSTAIREQLHGASVRRWPRPIETLRVRRDLFFLGRYDGAPKSQRCLEGPNVGQIAGVVLEEIAELRSAPVRTQEASPHLARATVDSARKPRFAQGRTTRPEQPQQLACG
jgi:hypothetical protein